MYYNFRSIIDGRSRRKLIIMILLIIIPLLLIVIVISVEITQVPP